jgi:hypothetical protein
MQLVRRARLETQSALLLTTRRANTPAKAKMSVKAKADAKLVTMAAKARILARARVAAPASNNPIKNVQNSIFSSSGLLK